MQKRIEIYNVIKFKIINKIEKNEENLIQIKKSQELMMLEELRKIEQEKKEEEKIKREKRRENRSGLNLENNSNGLTSRNILRNDNQNRIAKNKINNFKEESNDELDELSYKSDDSFNGNNSQTFKKFDKTLKN